MQITWAKKIEKQYFIITPILSAILKKICEILDILDKMGAHFREFTVTTNIFQSAHPPLEPVTNPQT